jgi:rare lipoprotein A
MPTLFQLGASVTRLALGLLIASLAACSSAPRSSRPHSSAVPVISAPAGAALDTDGPAANPPPDLIKVPDAEPRLEPVRAGGPNKPYAVAGHWYEPITHDEPYTEHGLGSWYGRKYHGRPTASGELYNMYAMTAAHPRLPIPSYARVRNPANGREVIVRINDRGPFTAGYAIDLSYTAALKLGLLRGVAEVEVERITPAMIRSGRYGAVNPAAALPEVAEESRADAIDPDDALALWLAEREAAAAGQPSTTGSGSSRIPNRP